MSRPVFFSHFYYILFCIAVLSIPFTATLNLYITPLLLLLWIIEGDWKNKWNRLKESNTRIITGAFVLFWIITVVGLLYSTDIQRGLMRIFDKLPFLVYPLLFFSLEKTFFTKKRMTLLLKMFIGATIAMLAICWGNAIVQYIITADNNWFYYINFSLLFGHPSYCTLIACIAFCTVLQFLFNPGTANLATCTPNRWLFSILLLFFAISIYFLQSRTGILTFILILILSLFYYLHIHKKTYWYGVGGIIIILLLATGIAKLFPNRIDYYMNKTEATAILGPRGEIWNSSYSLAMEHKWLGIGTGYQIESLLSESELQIFNKNHLFINTHNQFLQTFLDHGILGLTVLIFLMIFSCEYAIKTKDYLLLMLLISFVVNMLFESMLERHRGIFSFNLFYCLFVVKKFIFATKN